MPEQKKRIQIVDVPDMQLTKGQKIEARLNDTMETALQNYMRDDFRDNRADVCKSAIGLFLVKHGYLRKTRKGYVLTMPVKNPSISSFTGSFAQLLQIGAVAATMLGLTATSKLHYGKGLKDGRHALDPVNHIYRQI